MKKFSKVLFLLNLLILNNKYILCESNTGTISENCGGTFSGYQYMISSPNYPLEYPENQDCTYFLRGTRLARCDQEFHLQFLDLDLRPSENCEKDFLQIGERNIYCGSTVGLRTFRGENNVLKIRFHSGNGKGGKGFRIIVTTLPCVNFQENSNSNYTLRVVTPRKISTSEKTETNTKLLIEGNIEKNNQLSHKAESAQEKSKLISNRNRFEVETLSPVYRPQVIFPLENDPHPQRDQHPFDQRPNKNCSISQDTRKLASSTYLFLPPSTNFKKLSEFRNSPFSITPPPTEFSLPILESKPFRSTQQNLNLKKITFERQKSPGDFYGEPVNQVGEEISKGTDCNPDHDVEINKNNNWNNEGTNSPDRNFQANFGGGIGNEIGFGVGVNSGIYPGIGSGNIPGPIGGPDNEVGHGINPGIGSGNNPGIGSGIYPESSPGIGSGISPEIGSGSYPGIGSGISPGSYPGIGSGISPGSYPGIGSGISPGSYPGIGSGISPGSYPGIGSGINPGFGSGINPECVSGINPGFGSEISPGFGSGINPGFGSGINPGFVSGINPGFGSGINPGKSGEFDVGFTGPVLGPGSEIGHGINPGIGSGINPGIGSGINPGIGSGINPGIGSGINPGIGSGINSGIGSGINPGELFPNLGTDTNINPNPNYPIHPNYAPDFPGWSSPRSQCCNPLFPTQRSLITSPGFPTLNFSPTPFECGYTISKFSAAVCQLRLSLKFFNLGSKDPYCTNGHLEVDSRRICGCKTGLSLVLPFGNFPAKIIRVRYSGFPKSKFNGFLIEVVQEICGDNYPLIRNRKDLKRQNETSELLRKQDKFINSSKSIISHERRKREGYSYPKPTGHAILDVHSGGGRSESLFWNSCQSRVFLDWILAAKEAFIRGVRCPGSGNSAGINPVIPTPGGWNGFTGVCEEIAAIEGVITSPFYPNYYPNNFRKCYRFYKSRGFCRLELSVLDFNLESSLGCLKDYLLFSGQNIRYCGNSLSGTTTVFDISRSNVAEIYFMTDSSGSGRGFTAGFVQTLC